MIIKEHHENGSLVFIEEGDACQRCEKHKNVGEHLSKCQILYYFENVKCIFHAFIFSCRHSMYRPEHALRRVLIYFLNNGYTKEEIINELNSITGRE